MTTVFYSQCQHIISVHLYTVQVLVKRLAIFDADPDPLKNSFGHISIQANKSVDLLTTKIDRIPYIAPNMCICMSMFWGAII